ncbi:dolichyl-phosphate-mannose--protein O-mannosyl transferase [Kribbella sandramycini]|uniref:Polyprenol-phosphate-mannose--protein mannosyltransferase n=1 Tax=Kribbella sandramycini TaxID=60450 RepID=A0A841SQU4_9ACTN|nr:dolichyl-phosphate-mannose--protein O-mannosyl transferase [Kribbella sandramycini]
MTAVIEDGTTRRDEAAEGREALGRDVLGRRLPPLADRLYPPMPKDFEGGWIATLAITALAAFIRFWDLANPVKFVFDETYYAKDAFSLLKFGYARQFIDQPEGAADKAILAGNLDVFKPSPSLTVHPEVGKWMIAAGEQLFGMTPFGWRFMPALFGALTVLLVIRTVRRMTRSTLIGAIAGLLLAVDGLHFVMSRVALLDIFLAFWLVAAISCLVADRDWTRRRHADSVRALGEPDDFAPRKFGRWLLLRPWRILAGVCFGLALGTKWSAVWVIAGFGLLVFAWDLGARRALGVRFAFVKSALIDGVPAFLSIVLVALVTYTATWTGWLLHDNAYSHDYASKNPATGVMKIVPDDFRSLLHYHQEVYEFHTGDYIKNATHPYSSNPAGWPIIARPIGFDAVNDIKPGSPGCDAPAGTNCLSVISAVGTPLLWWGGALALLAAVVLWIGQRDWRFGVPIIGFVTCWVPWFAYDDRPIFFFYAVTMIPFTVMAVALVLGKILGPARTASGAAAPRRLIGSAIVGAFVVLVVLNFAYIWPILTDKVLPHPDWLSRMWFKTWI